jgi:hypothetical protein
MMNDFIRNRAELEWELTKSLVQFGGVSYDEAWTAVHTTLERSRKFNHGENDFFSVGELVTLADQAREALYPSILARS